MLCAGAALGLAVASSMVPSGLFASAPLARAASLLASPSFAGDVKYTVKPGDTLGAIADSFGVKAQAIQDANGIQDPNSIKAGMVITIPGASPPPTPTPVSTQYTVMAGDTLSGIAASQGVSAQAIQDANGLKDANSIKVGQVLTIPSGGQSAPATVPPSPSP